MIRAEIAESRVFQSWLDYQDALKRAIRPLTPEQLQHRPVPGRRTPGEVAEHIVFGRALHLHGSLGEAVELTPFLAWDDADDPPRTAAEIVEGLEVTWRVISEWIMRGTSRDEIDADVDVPVANVIWGLLDHDLPHAGQLSMLLRAGGLAGVEI